jgi:hypothetical protein
MSEVQQQSLAERIEAAIVSVPGVTAVYRPSGVASAIADLGARAIGLRTEDEPRLVIEAVGDETRIEASIGVAASVGAVEVCRRVHAAVVAACRAYGVLLAELHLTVAHVDERAPELPLS